MSDWATYTLQDLLLFSPRVYFRLIERYNQDFWPLQIVLIAAALAVLVPAAIHVRRVRLAVLPLLALAWAFCAWQFLWARYAGINRAMPYAAAAFWIQAALLVLVGLMARDPAPAGRLRHYGGIGLSVFGLLAYPFIAWLAGRSPVSAETFGMMPDPTVATTFGAMLMLGQRKLGLLLPIPVAWSLYSGLTLWAMRDPGALGPLAACAAFSVFLVAGRR
ncbi:hypothetical protein NGR_b20220 (plasmid) [Sinorhizobium fredii NGR234]|uniref:Cytochrome c-type biogenesis protein DsbD, protein-disulfide reductase n=1 Tax=Sinorhizobium fredii (strain NBRC 101917 / NGR234) TaxID=394 RepID=C3KM33_SINFN|nr:DUF6064 family protein [Sinorhizobium fredii]ACP23469.1 hypothetical protein NGR_b20220 [Sinorhizobium fredii NGR234]